MYRERTKKHKLHEQYPLRHRLYLKAAQVFHPILETFPGVRTFASAVMRTTTDWKFQTTFKKLNTPGDLGIDINRVYWAHPSQIVRYSAQIFDDAHYRGKVVDGNWDISGNRIEVMNRQADRSQLPETLPSPPVEDSIISVNVGRMGDILLNEKILPVAKLPSYDKVPLRITVRHPDWINFRKEILWFAMRQKHGKIYQPLTHMDLLDIPPFHDTPTDRFDLIRKALTARGGDVLDIGSHWGYFCHRFEEIGFDCWAVENNPEYLHFLTKLKRAENRRFTVVPRSIFDVPEIVNQEFDVVLALNIFHHFLKNKEDYAKLIQLLGSIRTREMYFQPHKPGELAAYRPVKNYSEEEFVAFVQQHTGLKNAQELGQEDGRRLFKLF